VTFFPDHGEDLQYLDEHAGHGQSIYTRHAFEIPAFVWFNDAYRLRYPEIVAHLTGNATREIRSHDVFYTLADLMGIQWPEADATRSFASDRFVPDTTSRHLAGGLLVGRAPSSGGAQSDERKVAAVPPANP
jgi:glucan phosphoethanolaminetransferase (alkaline phosphatase superfamily)